MSAVCPAEVHPTPVFLAVIKGRLSWAASVWWCGLWVLISGGTWTALFLPVKLFGNAELPGWCGEQRVAVVRLKHFRMASLCHPFVLCVLLHRELCQVGLCVPGYSRSLHKGQWDFLLPFLCWELGLFQLIALVTYLTVVLCSNTVIKDQFMIRKLPSYRQLDLFLSLNSHWWKKSLDSSVLGTQWSSWLAELFQLQVSVLLENEIPRPVSLLFF